MPTPAKPPSTASTCPVMNELSSEQRNTAVRACWIPHRQRRRNLNGKDSNTKRGPRGRGGGGEGATERGTYYLGGETKPRKRGLTHPGPDHVGLNVVRLAVLVHGRVLGCRARIVRHGHRPRTAPRSGDLGQRYAAGTSSAPNTPLPRACAAPCTINPNPQLPPVHTPWCEWRDVRPKRTYAMLLTRMPWSARSNAAPFVRAMMAALLDP